MCRLAEPQQQSTLLLYGLQGTGKSLLSNALAAETGAALFDISPAVTDGKWPGKSVAGMLATVSLFLSGITAAAAYNPVHATVSAFPGLPTCRCTAASLSTKGASLA